MAFRKQVHLPEGRKRELRQQEEKRNADFSETVVEPLMGLDLEDTEAEDAMKSCTCPKKNCPIHG